MSGASDAPEDHEEHEDHEDGLGWADFGKDTFLAEGETGEDEGDGLKLDAAQQEEIRCIFLTTLPQYLEPVEQMIDQLFPAGGPAAPQSVDAETFDALTATLASLSEASSRMGFEDVCRGLDRMGDRMSRRRGDSDSDETELRELLLDDLQLIRDITAEFADGQVDVAESSLTIVAALGHVQGVERHVLGRLTTAGLVRVDQLLMARPDEIVAVTGLPPHVVDTLLAALRSGDSPAAEHAAPSPPVITTQSQLSSRLAAQAAAQASIDDLQTKVQHARARSAALVVEVEDTTSSCDRARSELARLGTRFDLLAAKLGQLRAGNEVLERKLSGDHELLQMTERRVDELQATRRDLASEQLEFDGEVSALVERVENMLEIANKA